MALKNVVSACCSSVRGNLAAGKEIETKKRLISLVTGALTAATQQQARVLLNQPQAYANVVESLVILILTAVPAVNDSTAPVLLEQLGATVTSTLGTTAGIGSSPKRHLGWDSAGKGVRIGGHAVAARLACH